MIWCYQQWSGWMEFMNERKQMGPLTVQGGCIQGSPSICMGSRREVLETDNRGMTGEELVWGAEVGKGGRWS